MKADLIAPAGLIRSNQAHEFAFVVIAIQPYTRVNHPVAAGNLRVKRYGPSDEQAGYDGHASSERQQTA